MSTTLRDDSATTRTRHSRRRAAWRQWLVEAERGLTAGFRSDSIFFVHLFGGCFAIAASLMLGLSATQWAVVILALAVTIAAELFHQVLKQLGNFIDPTDPKPAAALRRFGAAGVAVATLGSATAVLMVLGSRLHALFAA